MDCKDCGGYVSLITLLCNSCGADYNPEERAGDSLIAFEVTYRVGGEQGCTEMLLVSSELDIPQALEQKSPNRFKAGRVGCQIDSTKEIPLSRVKIKELSVTEFMMLQGK